MTRIVCISDTHGYHDTIKVPDGDILIHAGDFTSSGKRKQIEDFNSWLGTLPHKEKIIIAGNHDFLFENEPEYAQSLITNATYLEDSGVIVNRLHIWGSPVQPYFGGWAFNRWRGEMIKKYWDRIPQNTNILITHGPPYMIGDRVLEEENVGCIDLENAVFDLPCLQLHVFGHIHEGYGTYNHKTKKNSVTFINASVCTRKYHPINPPLIIEL